MSKSTSEEAVQLVEYCIQNGYKISTARSCTGGLIAAGIVDVPGAQMSLKKDMLTYADRVKQKLLHVSVTTIQKYTVVSAQVAEEMALGTAQASGADISVTTTGYAGPEDGEDGDTGRNRLHRNLLSGVRREQKILL